MYGIITMAGRGKRFKELNFKKPKYLIEVMGKTLLEYSLQSLPLDKCDKIILALLKEDLDSYREDIENVLSRLSVSRDKFILNILTNLTRGQSETAFKCLHLIEDKNKPLFIYNIDTNFKYKFEHKLKNLKKFENFILGAKQEGEQWSFANTKSIDSNEVIEVAEKKRISDKALVGFYYFCSCDTFSYLFKNQEKNKDFTKGEFYIAPLYNYLIKSNYLVTYDEVEEFNPLGTPEEVYKFLSKNTITKPRDFNDIDINLDEQFVLKSSSKNPNKIIDEFNWYNLANKKEECKYFIPKVYDLQNDGVKETLKMEYVPFESASQIFLNHNLKESDRDDFTNKILFVIDRLKILTLDSNLFDKNNFNEKIYFKKNLERIDLLSKDKFFGKFIDGTNISFSGVLNKEELKINLDLRDFLIDLIQSNENNFLLGIFHGDLCLSNILFDVKTKNLKLIDPRGGDFYGDIYYDLAKLRHSLSGYDLIINNFYNLKFDDLNSIEFDIFWNNNINPKELKKLDKKFIEKGYDINKIKKVEFLLFLSMIPLHYEDKNRQKMLFLISLLKLKEIL